MTLVWSQGVRLWPYELRIGRKRRRPVNHLGLFGIPNPAT
jgi:hypothetical protein